MKGYGTLHAVSIAVLKPRIDFSGLGPDFDCQCYHPLSFHAGLSAAASNAPKVLSAKRIPRIIPHGMWE
jgi:hypothetical protein